MTDHGTGNSVLPYEPRGPRARMTAQHVRWGMLVLGIWLLVLALLFNPFLELHENLGYGIWGTPAVPSFGEGMHYLVAAIFFFAVFLLTQWLFLLPHGRLKLQSSQRAQRSMKLAAIGGAFVAMLLTTGLAATLLQLAGLWLPLFEWSYSDTQFSWLSAALLPLWAIWAVIFYLYSRKRNHYTFTARVFRGLLAGTVLELLVAAPAHAWIEREDDCYCARGSYTGLVFGLTAVFWLFGPGVFLMFLREKRRREQIPQ